MSLEERFSAFEQRFDRFLQFQEAQLAARTSSNPDLSPSSTEAPSLGEHSDSLSPTPSHAGTPARPLPGSPAIGLATDICWPPPATLPLPRDLTRKMKTVRKSLSDAGYFKPTFGLSKRNEKKEPVDLSLSWRSQYEAAVQARILLGPRPDPADTQASEWFSKLETLFTAQQAQAYFELALIEGKRIAPDLSKDRQVAIVSAFWPDWSRMTVGLHEAQERALTTIILSRKPAGADENPAGKRK